jgi:hypothetical protein
MFQFFILVPEIGVGERNDNTEMGTRGVKKSPQYISLHLNPKVY